MERNEQLRDELIVDLGSVTSETKGPGIQDTDLVGQLTVGGLSDD